MDIYKILILIGTVFGFFGACIAYLITLNEYKRRDIPGMNYIVESFKVAAFTFVFFLALCIALAFIFAKLNL